MAEVFAAVSSGAGLLSLAIQLLECGKKLKDFCKRFKDAPRSLQELTYDLETISLSLQGLEGHRLYDSHDAMLLERCVLRCQRDVGEIQTTVDGLESTLRKNSGLGKVYTALKAQDIERSLAALERAKSSIMLAFQMYCWSRQSARNEEQHRTSANIWNAVVAQGNRLDALSLDNSVQRSLIQQVLRSLPDTGNTFISSDLNTARTSAHPWREMFADNAEDDRMSGETSVPENSVIRKRKYYIPVRNTYRTRLSFASWFTGRIWDIAATRLEGAWTFSFRTYNVVPYHSSIFASCRGGDLPSVKKLLASREASLYDQDPYGWNLLDTAAFHGKLEICVHLLKATTIFSEEEIGRAFDHFADHNNSDQTRDTIEKAYQFFVDEANIDEIDLEEQARKGRYESLGRVNDCRTRACAEAILRAASPSYRRLSFFDRCRLAARLTDLTWVHRPDVFLTWAGLRNATTLLANFKDDDGSTILHFAARMIGNGLCWSPSANIPSWMLFAQQLIELGADPMALTSGRTPLYTMLETICEQGSDHMFYCLCEAVRIWALILRNAGIDLGQYSCREYSTWERFGSDQLCTGVFNHVTFNILSPVFASNIQRSSVRVQRCTTVRTFELQLPPGSWNTSLPPITNICWEPSATELEEGPWVETCSMHLESEPFDAREEEERSDFQCFLVDSPLHRSQDDTGPIISRISSRKCVETGRKRSSSQPPSIARRELAYVGGRDAWTSYPVRRRRYWLPPYHVCPFDGRIRFDCLFDDDREVLRDGYRYGLVHIRECVKGISHLQSFQDTLEWKIYSFTNPRWLKWYEVTGGGD